MGLFDSVLGAVMNSQGGQSTAGMGTSSGLGSGLGGLIGLATSNPQLLQVITGMLSNTGGEGGLGGLIGKFQQAGLGDAMASWIGSGPNQHASADQISDALGRDSLSQIAAQLGLSPDAAAGQLSQMLPKVIDHLTPNGQMPAGGLGNSGDLMGMLGGLLTKR